MSGLGGDGDGLFFGVAKIAERLDARSLDTRSSTAPAGDDSAAGGGAEDAQGSGDGQIAFDGDGASKRRDARC